MFKGTIRIGSASGGISSGLLARWLEWIPHFGDGVTGGYEFTVQGQNTLEATEGADVFNSPFGLGKVDETYTSNRVVESFETVVSGTTKLAWHPVVLESVKLLDANGDEVEGVTGIAVAADGTITLTGSPSAAIKKIAYAYDNIVVPQEKIPTLKAVMKSIPLIARARRIAVYLAFLH